VRVVHVDNLQIRRYGRLKVSTGRKLFHGMIRNNWRVCEFSERDIARYEAPLGIRTLGIVKANKRLVETCANFVPDLVILGHCDMIRNETLARIREVCPQVKIAYRNVDPLWEERNVARIRERMHSCDGLFVSTGGDALKQFCTGKNVVAFIPNPTDPAVEDQQNFAKSAFERDLVFCGVGNPTDDRYPLVRDLHAEFANEMRFDSFGMHGKAAVWGQGYDAVMASSKMGLNLNRFEGWPLYSSARISQMMGNGLLTFLWDQGEMRRFFSDDQAAFFKGKGDLVKQCRAFQADDARRQAVAEAGHRHYHTHFCGARVAAFMADVTLGRELTHPYIWQDEIYR